MISQFAINNPILDQDGLSALLRSLLNPLDGGMQDYINPYSSLITEILRTISDRQPIGDRTQGNLDQGSRSPSIRSGVASRSVPGELAPSFIGAPNRGFDINTLFPGFPRSPIPVGQPIPPIITGQLPVRGQQDFRDSFVRNNLDREFRPNLIGGIIPYGL